MFYSRVIISEVFEVILQMTQLAREAGQIDRSLVMAMAIGLGLNCIVSPFVLLSTNRWLIYSNDFLFDSFYFCWNIVQQAVLYSSTVCGVDADRQTTIIGTLALAIPAVGLVNKARAMFLVRLRDRLRASVLGL
eukprot:g771.t1